MAVKRLGSRCGVKKTKLNAQAPLNIDIVQTHNVKGTYISLPKTCSPALLKPHIHPPVAVPQLFLQKTAIKYKCNGNTELATLIHPVH